MSLSFREFWWRCFKTAAHPSWKIFGHLRGANYIIAFIISLVPAVLGARLIVKVGPNGFNTALFAPIAVFFIVFLCLLIKAPHTIYLNTEEVLGDKIEENEETIVALQTELQAVQAECDDATQKTARKRNAEITLANCVLELRKRAKVLRQLDGESYTPQVHKREGQETKAVMERIFKLLGENCGEGIATLFLTTDYRAESSIDPNDEILNRGEYEQQAHLMWIEGHINELRRIIDKQTLS